MERRARRDGCRMGCQLACVPGYTRGWWTLHDSGPGILGTAHQGRAHWGGMDVHRAIQYGMESGSGYGRRRGTDPECGLSGDPFFFGESPDFGCSPAGCSGIVGGVPTRVGGMVQCDCLCFWAGGPCGNRVSGGSGSFGLGWNPRGNLDAG